MVFELFQKLHLLLYASQFMTPNYSSLIGPFESEKYEKEVKKLEILEHLENEKSFSIEHFIIVFEEL